MTITELLGHTTEQLEAMSDEQLRIVLADCLRICPIPDKDKRAATVVDETVDRSKPVRAKKQKLSPREEMMMYAKELGLDIAEKF